MSWIIPSSAKTVASRPGIGYPVRARTTQKEILVEWTHEHFPNPPDSVAGPGLARRGLERWNGAGN